jgi:hypothetical protein
MKLHMLLFSPEPKILFVNVFTEVEMDLMRHYQ